MQTANGDFTGAKEGWRTLYQQDASLEVAAQNIAVCLLYSGEIAEARTCLESLARDTSSFSTSLLNLSTIYELCTEQASTRKAELAQLLAAKSPGVASGGWERGNADFKL